MQHTLRFAACDDGTVLLEEPTLVDGLARGYERGPWSVLVEAVTG
jgi:hypothetical protein